MFGPLLVLCAVATSALGFPPQVGGSVAAVNPFSFKPEFQGDFAGQLSVPQVFRPQAESYSPYPARAVSYQYPQQASYQSLPFGPLTPPPPVYQRNYARPVSYPYKVVHQYPREYSQYGPAAAQPQRFVPEAVPYPGGRFYNRARAPVVRYRADSPIAEAVSVTPSAVSEEVE